MVQDIALVHALGEIQTREAASHLWLEEYVTGDEIHLGEVWENQDRSLALIHAILDGGRVGTDRYSVKPLEEPSLRRRAVDIQRQMREFERIARRRHEGYERREDVGVGSALDIEYDRVFKGMLADLRSLQSAVDDELDRAHAQSRLLFRTILTAWIAIVSLAVTGLWTRERRRLLAEAALRESEAQLLQSQKMEAVGRLAGGLAHDINNYLAAVTAQCDLAKLSPGDAAAVRSRMDSVVSTVSKAAALIRRLLAFSRSEPLETRIVNLNRVVADLEPMLARLIGEDVQLTTELDPELWNVESDPSQLEQVVVNLVVNAREALPAGGDVALQTRNVRRERGDTNQAPALDAGDYVVLTVSDTGIGIPHEIRERIFEPFVTTKDKTTNSGLGLATVYAIVRQVRGTIRVESDAGKGSSFGIYLPRSHAEETRSAAPNRGRMAGGGQRILLVEDNDDLRESAREALEVFGYSVATAATGEQALEIFRANPAAVDLVITDVVMPGMNARQVVERLRHERGDLPVILVSGYTGDVVVRHGVDQADVSFVPKPFSMDALAHKIQEVLGGTQLRAGGSAS